MPDDKLTLTEAAKLLGVHYMTVYRYVRTGRLPAVRGSSTWVVDAGDLAAVQEGARHLDRAEKMPAEGDRGARELARRLLAGDEMGAWTIAESALSSGMSPERFMLDLLAPAMSGIGEEWERGSVSVADEHRASSVATRLLGRLGARFNRRGVKRGAVVLVAPEGELHALPIYMAANVLRWRGYEVIEVGAHTPAAALAATVSSEARGRGANLLAVAISCTTRGAVEAGAEMIGVLRMRLGHGGMSVPVLIGGAAIEDEEHAMALGADAYSGRRADDLAEAVAVLEETPPGAA